MKSYPLWLIFAVVIVCVVILALLKNKESFQSKGSRYSQHRNCQLNCDRNRSVDRETCWDRCAQRFG